MLKIQTILNWAKTIFLTTDQLLGLGLEKH